MKSLLLPAILAAFFAGALCVSGYSQESSVPDLSPDRPSVGVGPDVVPWRSLQLENGANVVYTKSGYVADLPETLTRLGMGGRTELRVSTSNWGYSSDGSGAKMQFEDVTVGVKVGLTHANHLMMQSVLYQTSFPTGGDLLTTGSVDPSGTLIWAQMAKGWNVVENVGALWTTEDGVRRTSFLPGIAVAHPLTKKTGFWAEYAPVVSAGGSMVHIVDGGFTYNLSNVRQLDTRVGVERDASGVHNIASVGYTFRLDGLGGRRGRVE